MERMARLARGLGPGRHPLHRRCDTLEARILAGLLAVLLVCGPLLAVASRALGSAEPIFAIGISPTVPKAVATPTPPSRRRRESLPPWAFSCGRGWSVPRIPPSLAGPGGPCSGILRYRFD